MWRNKEEATKQFHCLNDVSGITFNEYFLFINTAIFKINVHVKA
jgi:hypothetical protein